jgi:NAD(P)-dependent dehydrogenase (short-subunit alcohol dehydrogenase family)
MGFGMGDVLKGKVALVTGANSGIGLAIAKRFAAEGARVVLAGRRQPELDAAAAEIGPAALAVRTDVANLEELERLVTTIEDRYQRLDIVVANAGGGSFAPLGQITEEHFDATFDTNVKGAVFTVQQALPLLGAGGSIILTGSTASLTGIPAFSIYGASKAAIRALVRHWAQHLRGTGIRVNVLSPGSTDTPGVRGLVPEEQEDAMLGKLAQAAPLGRVADPTEIAGAALFLASDASSYVHGAELFVDGGAAQV